MTSSNKNDEMKVVVIDESGRECHNLWGVFRRQFSIAFTSVVRSGKPISVDYYGKTYQIAYKQDESPAQDSELPHASDCAHHCGETCDCVIGREADRQDTNYTVHHEVARLHDEEGMDWTSALVSCNID